jgi:hypothetical protein
MYSVPVPTISKENVVVVELPELEPETVAVEEAPGGKYSSPDPGSSVKSLPELGAEGRAFDSSVPAVAVVELEPRASEEGPGTEEPPVESPAEEPPTDPELELAAEVADPPVGGMYSSPSPLLSNE